MNFNKIILCAILCIGICSTYAQTVVSSNIYSSTTWTKSGSPYIIPNNLVVFDVATLTIQPGVTVLFGDGVSVDFRGQLVANGSAAERITFTSNNANPTKGIYGGFVVTGYTGGSSLTNQITMKYCNISYAQNFMNLIRSCQGPFNISHCYFYENYYGIGDSPDCGDLNIDSCKFESNYMGARQDENGEVYVTNCFFLNNTNGTNADYVMNSVFAGNVGTAVSSYTVLQNCEIYANNIGAEWDGHASTTFINNNIHDNSIGVLLDRFFNEAGVSFYNNKICNNSAWNIEYLFNHSVDLSGNCFCSTDSAYIHSKIRDGYVDPSYGLISFTLRDICNAGIVTKVKNVSAINIQPKVYPNPFYDQATIEFSYDHEHNYQFKLFDQLGRVVRSVDKINSGRLVVDRNDLPSGIYFYHFYDNYQLAYSGKLLAE